jgi:hypothetical protein
MEQTTETRRSGVNMNHLSRGFLWLRDFNVGL